MTEAALGRRPLPRWASPLLLAVAAGLVPWTVWMGWSLPRRHVVHHWDFAWAGFDALLTLALATTAFAVAKRRAIVATAAPIVATLLVCDAWFDVVTAGDDSELWFALALACFAELPIAAFCLWLTRAVVAGRA